MTISQISRTEPAELGCAIGGHTFRPYMVSEESFVHTEIDGTPLCMEHYIEIANHKASTQIDERRIRDAIHQRDERAAETRTIDRMRSVSNKPGWLYYIRTDGLIKIGYTTDIRSRRNAYSPTAELLAAHPGTRGLETSIHHQFAELRERGREWFRPGPVLLAHIDSVNAQYGSPDALVKPMRHARNGGRKSFASRVLS